MGDGERQGADLGVSALLASFAGGRAYFQAYPGNHGDRLIDLGTLDAMRRAGLRLTQMPGQAELIVFKGGAGISDLWAGGLEPLRAIAANYPQTPLAVMPSSFWLSSEHLASILAPRNGPTYLFARDSTSYERIASARLGSNVTVGLDHDMAFGLAGTPMIQALKRRPSKGYVLLVERRDAESGEPDRNHLTLTPGSLSGSFASGFVRSAVPYGLRLAARRQLLARRYRRQVAEPPGPVVSAWLQDMLPELAGRPVKRGDVSMPEYYSYREFQELVAEAAAVVTDRLHVGILAALLGKRTVMLADALGKLSGVYDQSMAGMGHVSCVPRWERGRGLPAPDDERSRGAGATQANEPVTAEIR